MYCSLAGQHCYLSRTRVASYCCSRLVKRGSIGRDTVLDSYLRHAIRWIRTSSGVRKKTTTIRSAHTYFLNCAVFLQLCLSDHCIFRDSQRSKVIFSFVENPFFWSNDLYFKTSAYERLKLTDRCHNMERPNLRAPK